PFHELSTLVLGKLGLPPLITVPIEEFFERGVRKQGGGIGSLLARALRIANVYAHGLMLAPAPDAPITPVSKAEYRNSFGDSPAPAINGVDLRAEILTSLNALAGL